MNTERKNIFELCKAKLLEKKAELINQYREYKNELTMIQHRGDEGDKSVGILMENKLLSDQERTRATIYEVEFALAKLEKGLYGYCEETEELIAPERLLALPWTRYSLEGAEIKEQITKKFAP